MPEANVNAAAVQGTLKERPFPRLLQQLYRKQFTGHFIVTDQTRDQSEVYMREGAPVHVCRPVDTDRLDNLLVEYGLVPAGILAQASAQVTEGQRLGDVLERMGVLDKGKLAQVLKAQVTRKLTRLFFIAEGDYAVYLAEHGFGKDSDFPLMRVDPRTLMYPGIRAAYNLPRVTRELSRLAEQRFRLAEISPAFIAALGIFPGDSAVAWLRKGWMMLDDLDAVTSRPFEVRSVVLALYYADCLERESLSPPAEKTPEPQELLRGSGTYRVSKLSSESGAAVNLDPPATADVVKVPSAAAAAPGSAGPPAPAPAGAPSPSGVTAAEPGKAPVAAPAVSLPASQEAAARGAVKVVPAAPIAPTPAAKLPSPVAPVAPPAAPPPVAPAPARPRPSGTMPVAGAPAQPAPAPAAALRPSGTIPVVTAGGPALAAPTSASVPVVRAPFVSAVRGGTKSAAAPGKPAAATPAAEATRAAILDMAAKLEKSTHFEILGIPVSASSDEVGAAFVRAARQFHPDRLAGAGLTDLQPLAEKILARINEAAMVLGSPQRRAEYVASLMAGAQTAQNLPTLLEAENWFLKGEVFLKKGDHAKAIEAFTAAIKNNPDEPQYHAYQAWARFDDPRSRKESISRETLKILERVLKDRPKFARGFYWVGQLWKFLNETGKAEHAFREAVQIDESFIEASRELRLIEMRKGKGAGKHGAKPAAKPEGKGKFWKR